MLRTCLLILSQYSIPLIEMSLGQCSKRKYTDLIVRLRLLLIFNSSSLQSLLVDRIVSRQLSFISVLDPVEIYLTFNAAPIRRIRYYTSKIIGNLSDIIFHIQPSIFLGFSQIYFQNYIHTFVEHSLTIESRSRSNNGWIFIDVPVGSLFTRFWWWGESTGSIPNISPKIQLYNPNVFKTSQVSDIQTKAASSIWKVMTAQK